MENANAGPQPQVGVGVIVFRTHNGAKQVLLHRRQKVSAGAGYWGSGGGYLEHGESLRTGALRELREEAGDGLMVTNVRFLGVCNFTDFKPGHSVDISFAADWVSGEPQPDKLGEAVDWRWFNLQQLPSPLFPVVERYLRGYHQGIVFSDSIDAQVKADQLRLAGCILVNERDQILLLHRIKRDQWEIPGGKIDELVNGRIIRSGASAEATVERELREELCVDVDVVRKLGDREFSEDQYVMHYTWYLGRIKGNAEPAIGEPGKYDGLRAFSLSELKQMQGQLSGNTKNFVDAWATGEFSLQ